MSENFESDILCPGLCKNWGKWSPMAWYRSFGYSGSGHRSYSPHHDMLPKLHRQATHLMEHIDPITIYVVVDDDVHEHTSIYLSPTSCSTAWLVNWSMHQWQYHYQTFHIGLLTGGIPWDIQCTLISIAKCILVCSGESLSHHSRQCMYNPVQTENRFIQWRLLNLC